MRPVIALAVSEARERLPSIACPLPPRSSSCTRSRSCTTTCRRWTTTTNAGAVRLSHIAFDEATALLAGDALLTEAFRLALSYPTPMVGRELAQATLGMIGGQYRDVTGDTADLAALHRLKTGALFAASVGVALWVAEVPEGEQPAWRAFGDELGLLFQIVDDLLDGDGYAATHGVEEARRLADEAAERAVQRLQAIPADTSVLAEIVAGLAARTA